ncbi:MAG: GC-type dockerin domain-anchored protein [Planctomycetota bacterium]
MTTPTRIIVCFGLSLGACPPAASQPLDRDGVWSPLPDLPIDVSNNAVTSVDHGDGTWSVYSFMGIRSPGNGVNATVESFRLDWSETAGALGGWQRIADAPRRGSRAKVAASAVTVAGEVYLIGGYTTGRREFTEERLFRYDPATDSYTELAPVPTEVDDTVPSVYRDRYIYLVSGWHGPINDNTTAVQVYDTRTDTWASCTPIPGPADGLFGHVGGIAEDDAGATLLYADGTTSDGTGFNASSRVYVGRITGDSIAEIIWTEIDPHPGLNTYRAAGSLGTTPNGWILIEGGTDNPYNLSGIGYDGIPSEPLTQTLGYHAETGRWRTLTFPGKPATMDHRNLARLGDGWVLAGGMTAPREMTAGAWHLTLDDCIADFDANGVIDVFDRELFVDRFRAGDPSADQNGDGQVTPADYTAWIARSGRGCL